MERERREQKDGLNKTVGKSKITREKFSNKRMTLKNGAWDVINSSKGSLSLFLPRFHKFPHSSFSYCAEHPIGLGVNCSTVHVPSLSDYSVTHISFIHGNQMELRRVPASDRAHKDEPRNRDSGSAKDDKAGKKRNERGGKAGKKKKKKKTALHNSLFPAKEPPVDR